MLTKVVEISVPASLCLSVRFNDGTQGVHDCRADIAGSGPLLQALQDPAYFARVFLEFGAPTWPNGFDMDPEWLRREMQSKGELQRTAAE